MRLKNIQWILPALLLVGGTGCKKILDQSVKGSYTPGDFFTSDANAQQAVNEAYKYLSFTSGANNAIWVLGDLASDDAVKGGSSVGDQPDFQAVNQFNILTTNAAVEAVWKQYYNGVFACNVVLDGLTGNSLVSSTMQTQGIAQARFLRAYYYFILASCYGNIPLHLKVETAEEAQTPARPQDTIFVQIESDCIAAAADLPASTSSLGVATKGQHWHCWPRPICFIPIWPIITNWRHKRPSRWRVCLINSPITTGIISTPPRRTILRRSLQ